MDQVLIASIIQPLLYVALLIIFVVRILLRPHRNPASRVAWIVLLIALPVIGILAYILLGEINIGRRRVERAQRILARLSSQLKSVASEEESEPVDLPQQYVHLFQTGKSINGFDVVGGNRAQLLADSNAVIDTMVVDIDRAKEHVHLLFYIWLPDNNGGKIVAALKRAAARGVSCRAMADGMGSRSMIASVHWPAMRDAGVQLAVALPLGNPLLGPVKGRIDLRNHRKIVIVDDWISYCGSQNCADPEFRVKARYAPWVDAMMRFEGPVVRQNQYLFAADWEAETGENIDELLLQSPSLSPPGFPAQVIGTGPTARYSAMPEMFETLIYAARHQLTITTPYYVPDESMQAALCASARRGVETTVIFPWRNDSWVVSAASRSYYANLVAAGVHIFEYQGGLLHTKSLTLDGEITLIGSANMDRRSFELNFENNILFYDPALTAAMLQRQHNYLAQSISVTATTIAAWGWYRRLWNNTIAMFGPIL